MAFELAMQAGLLGSPYDIPQSLQGSDIRFKFKSPLSQSEEEEKATLFSQMSQMLAAAAEHDPGVVANVNFDEACRDAILSIGSPAKWLTSVEQVLQSRQTNAVKEAVQMGIEAGVPLTSEQ
jgi:type II secretory pathway component PulL